WMGKCPDCGEWNTIVEEKIVPARQSRARSDAGDLRVVPITRYDLEAEPAIKTGLDEFDHLIGGGIVPASSILIGGEPGIGKSTLMLQVAGALAERGYPTLYLTGEESAQQVALRGRRL